MQIVCPNCQTSYSVAANALGANGRNVRCAKCKEVWLATPEEAIVSHVAAPAEAGADVGEAPDQQHVTAAVLQGTDAAHASDAPMVESPSIAHDGSSAEGWAREASSAEDDNADDKPRARRGPLPRRGVASPLRPNLSIVCAAMAALLLGLVIWRNDIVRLMPQTAAFFKMAGMNVNLRNLNFEAVRVSTEMIDGAPVAIIEGTIAAIGTKPVEIPRLRFVVRDEHGTGIYAWNAVLEQAVLQPGERAPFKSRLASPPPDAHDLIVRFFNKRDIAAGGA
jgi:predicted Zn finger-like uncharacterized protein